MSFGKVQRGVIVVVLILLRQLLRFGPEWWNSGIIILDISKVCQTCKRTALIEGATDLLRFC